MLVGQEERAALAGKRPIKRCLGAVLDVQTIPPCRPQKAFRLAAEFT